MKKFAITLICFIATLVSLSAQDYSQINNYEKLKKFEYNFDKDSIIEYGTSIIDNQSLNQGLLAWNYNNIIGLEPNSILITKGGNDTYPLWILQQNKHIREDIIVVCLDLMKNLEYREKLFNKYDIPNTSSNEPKDLIDHLLNAKLNRTIYLSSTIDNSLRKNLISKLYPIGLPLQYSNSTFNNVQRIKDNYEDKFMLDYLNNKLFASLETENLKNANLHYLPSFLLLEEHYLSAGEEHKAAKINWLMKDIASTAGKSQELDNYYNKNNQVIVYKRELPFEELEKDFVNIDGDLFAHKMELSNKWYNFFLDDLLYRKEYELVKLYGSKKTDWESFLTGEEKKLGPDKIYERGYPADDYLPVQHITKEAAEAFCLWLSERYAVWNGSKEFNGVKFHLPTKEQWQLAAKGNKSVSNYPWDFDRDSPKKEKFNPKGPKNIKGCYLGNFYSNEEVPCKDCPVFQNNPSSQDGAFFTVRVDAYWPNALGLYNCVGNVAEMTADEGAIGGGWYTDPNESTINHVESINDGTPWIGFRLFMTINE